MNKNKQFLMCLTLGLLSACGSSGDSDTDTGGTLTPPPSLPTNNAPSHNGNLNFSYAESAPLVTIDLLNGATDSNGDVLLVTDVTADVNNPAQDGSVVDNILTITPADFIDQLAVNQQQTIKYNYKISDGNLSVSRTVTIVIEGESPEMPKNEQVRVSIDLGGHQYFAQSGQLQRNKFFNSHNNFAATENSNAMLDLYHNDWRIDHGRSFWSSMSIAVQQLGEAQYPSTEWAKTQGANELAKYYANPRLQLLSNRNVDTDRYYKMVVPNDDPIEGARWNADYYEYFFDDKSRPLFYEPMNEPFVHASEIKSQFGNDEAKVRERMTLWFKELGKAMDERLALKDMKLIGFASAWPSLEKWDFGHWNDRMKMYMDNAGEYTDAFSVHLYNGINVVGSETQRSGSNAQAIMDLIETYSSYKWGLVKPLAITEYGNIINSASNQYSPWANSIRLRAMNQLLMEFLNREERLLTTIPFLTGLASWHWADPMLGNGHPYNPSLWRPDLNKIELVKKTVNGQLKDWWVFKDPNDPDNYLPNHNQIFYEMWKDLDGRRLNITSPDPDLQTMAYGQGNSAFVLLTSLEDEGDKDVSLNLSTINGLSINKVRIERLSFNDTVGAVYQDESKTITVPVGGELTMLPLSILPGETIKLTFTTDNALPIERTLQRQLYYAKEHLQAITAGAVTTFTINNVDNSTLAPANSTVMLRMGIARALGQSLQPSLTFNGTSIAVPDDWAGYDQSTRDEFFGAIEIPIPYALLEKNNTITTSFAQSGGRISSMVLTVNNQVAPILVNKVTLGSDMSIEENKTLRLTAEVVPAHAQNTALAWTSSNTSVATVTPNGMVSSLKSGTTMITATSVNGLSDSLILTVIPPPANLVQHLNPDFETGVFAPWNTYWDSPATTVYEVADTAAKTGKYGLHISISDDTKNSGITYDQALLPQLMGENKGRRFMLSFDIKANNAASLNKPIKFILVAQQHWDARHEVTLNPLISTDWIHVEHEFDEMDWSVPKAAGHDYRLELFFVAGKGKTDVYIDNLSIEVIE